MSIYCIFLHLEYLSVSYAPVSRSNKCVLAPPPHTFMARRKAIYQSNNIQIKYNRIS